MPRSDTQPTRYIPSVGAQIEKDRKQVDEIFDSLREIHYTENYPKAKRFWERLKCYPGDFCQWFNPFIPSGKYTSHFLTFSSHTEYCNRMIKKKFSSFEEFSCFVCLRTRNKHEEFDLSVCMSVCLSIYMSVCLSVCTYVRMWILAVGAITFEKLVDPNKI